MCMELEQNEPLDSSKQFWNCFEVNKTKDFFQNKISDKSCTEIKHTS